jgi:4a-hydroxytetrahydrobiopterin dehydratase
LWTWTRRLQPGRMADTEDDGEASNRPQAGNDAWKDVAMIARWGRERRTSGRSRDYLSDALTLLQGWTRDGGELRRTLRLDDAQHVALAERVKVAADALQLRPDIRRLNGHTQIKLCTPDPTLSAGEIALAARIEDFYRTIIGVA